MIKKLIIILSIVTIIVSGCGQKVVDQDYIASWNGDKSIVFTSKKDSFTVNFDSYEKGKFVTNEKGYPITVWQESQAIIGDISEIEYIMEGTSFRPREDKEFSTHSSNGVKLKYFSNSAGNSLTAVQELGKSKTEKLKKVYKCAIADLSDGISKDTALKDITSIFSRYKTLAVTSLDVGSDYYISDPSMVEHIDSYFGPVMMYSGSQDQNKSGNSILWAVAKKGILGTSAGYKYEAGQEFGVKYKEAFNAFKVLERK